jgi:hypothetical protein
LFRQVRFAYSSSTPGARKRTLIPSEKVASLLTPVAW